MFFLANALVNNYQKNSRDESSNEKVFHANRVKAELAKEKNSLDDALDPKFEIEKNNQDKRSFVNTNNDTVISDTEKENKRVSLEIVDKKEKPELQKEKPAFNQNLESVKTEKVVYKELVNQQNIEYTRKYINDSSVTKGTSFVQTAGQNGIREIVSKIKYVNDQEVSREIISDKVIKNPVEEVVIVGNKVEYLDSSGQNGLMVVEINKSRNEKGLQSLNRSLRLDEAASIRVREIVNTFSHNRPDGRPFYSVDPDFVAGENIAYSACDVYVLHERFLNSPSHRDNILRPEFKSVGVASFKEATGPTYWVILFSRY